MKLLGRCLAFCVSLATAGFLYAAAFAQEQGKGKEDVYSEEQYRETQALIDRVQAKINTINSAVSERDREIEFLNKQINEAIKFIASERADSVTLRENSEYLQDELKNVYETQDELISRLTEVTSENEKVVADLRSEVSALNERLSREQETATGLRQELGDLAAKLRSTAADQARIEEEHDEARQALSADKKPMQSRLAEISSVKREIAALGAAK